MNTHTLTRKHTGYLLMELAIVLALIAITLPPLMQSLRSQESLHKEQTRLGTNKAIMDAVEAFVLAHHRLPCPSDTQNGTEYRSNGHCLVTSGWVPSKTLSIPPQEDWYLTIATLSAAGAPAQDALTADNPFEHISPQQLAEVIYSPPTASKPVGSGPLPAIHLCQHSNNIAAPSITQAGCGALPLYSASAVLVLTPGPQQASISPLQSLNQNRTLQFLIHPDLQNLNPQWLSFERLNWLWMQSGAFNPL